jgi:A/G-specific adenine glycosylase
LANRQKKSRVIRLDPLSATALRTLVMWYANNHRRMPWRETPTPYRVWISEILLQQTQVETVRPYFFRFLRAFPTVEKLAAASLDEVLKAWEGCGYYARARNIHRAAKEIVKRGGFPRTRDEWLQLPGVGRYTAAAIASIVYHEPVAAFDGNVERVLARVLCERRVARTILAGRRLRAAADYIVHTAVYADLDAGDINQALMELGAVICAPRRVQCSICPLRSECRAYRTLSDATVLPRKAPAKAIPHYDIGAAIIQKSGRILITQRPLDGMLGGLWEFPGGKRQSGESLPKCVAREIREELGIEILVGAPFASVRHAYSHFRITLHAFLCKHCGGRLRKIGVADFRWVTPEQLSDYAFPKADRVIIEQLQQKS